MRALPASWDQLSSCVVAGERADSQALRGVLARDWSPPMDGITATIWASQTTLPHGWPDQRRPARNADASAGNEETTARQAEDDPSRTGDR